MLAHLDAKTQGTAGTRKLPTDSMKMSYPDQAHVPVEDNGDKQTIVTISLVSESHRTIAEQHEARSTNDTNGSGASLACGWLLSILERLLFASRLRSFARV